MPCASPGNGFQLGCCHFPHLTTSYLLTVLTRSAFNSLLTNYCLLLTPYDSQHTTTKPTTHTPHLTTHYIQQLSSPLPAERPLLTVAASPALGGQESGQSATGRAGGWGYRRGNAREFLREEERRSAACAQVRGELSLKCGGRHWARVG